MKERYYEAVYTLSYVCDHMPIPDRKLKYRYATHSKMQVIQLCFVGGSFMPKQQQINYRYNITLPIRNTTPLSSTALRLLPINQW